MAHRTSALGFWYGAAVHWSVQLLLALLVAWVLLHAKTSRADGDLRRVHPYRRIMFYLLPTKADSLVYFDTWVDATKLQAWLKEAGPRTGADVTHAAVAAVGIGLAVTPNMNRFVKGHRLYQRRGRWISFSMKRRQLDREAKLSTVKTEVRDGESFRDFCARVNGGIGEERSGKRTRADKEFDLFNLLPRPVFTSAAAFIMKLDDFNLLPRWYIEQDPLYTSVFVANLGSLKMGAGYHHLFEYGTCPLFMMVGQIEDRVVPVDGVPAVRPMLHVRWTYDERIDDGLNARHGIDGARRVLEDPATWLGGTDEASDFSMWPRAEAASPV